MAGTYNVSSATTLNFGSAESLVGSATFGGPGTVAVTGSDTLVGNSTITISGTGGFTFSGIISGDAPGRSLTKAGIGTLTLSGPNAYTGGTILNGGTLRAANTSGSATGSGAVTVASSATLAGGNGGGSANPFNDSTQGFISGAVTVQSGGIVGPGNNGVGLLTANGGFDFQAGSIFAVDLASHILRSGPTPLDVNTNDRIHTALTLSFGSSLTLDIDGGGQTFPFVNTYDYFIASADGSVGALPTDVTFVPTNFASAVKPSDFALSRSADGHDLILSYTAVPEPGSLVLLGTAAAIAGWCRRRRV
jgi:fibronectin-binding autotransporter adhesin